MTLFNLRQIIPLHLYHKTWIMHAGMGLKCWGTRQCHITQHSLVAALRHPVIWGVLTFLKCVISKFLAFWILCFYGKYAEKWSWKLSHIFMLQIFFWLIHYLIGKRELPCTGSFPKCQKRSGVESVQRQELVRQFWPPTHYLSDHCGVDGKLEPEGRNQKFSLGPRHLFNVFVLLLSYDTAL